jgi:hypothetical protein
MQPIPTAMLILGYSDSDQYLDNDNGQPNNAKTKLRFHRRAPIATGPDGKERKPMFLDCEAAPQSHKIQIRKYPGAGSNSARASLTWYTRSEPDNCIVWDVTKVAAPTVFPLPAPRPSAIWNSKSWTSKASTNSF